MDPAIQRLRDELKNKVSLRYCMGGLIPGWDNFDDPINSVSRPLQMGPVWMHAASVTGMKVDFNLWHRDPPASSYPSCIAFKCVQLQSELFADTFLWMMREACMAKGINIARPAALLALAEDLKETHPGFDLKEFELQLSLDKGEGLAAFKKDLAETRLNNIRRFPTLIIRKAGAESLVATGYRPYEALMATIEKMQTGNEPVPGTGNPSPDQQPEQGV